VPSRRRVQLSKHDKHAFYTACQSWQWEVPSIDVRLEERRGFVNVRSSQLHEAIIKRCIDVHTTIVEIAHRISYPGRYGSFQGPALAMVVCFGRRSRRIRPVNSTKETVLMPPRSPASPPLVSTGPPHYRCVECSHPVSSLYTIYSKDNVRLTQCVPTPF
jgi:hypothetical protein